MPGTAGAIGGGGAGCCHDGAGASCGAWLRVLPVAVAGMGVVLPRTSSLVKTGARKRTPIVVFAHIPLYVLYEQWGWGTDDGARALALLKRFGSVTVLNGHIHQLAQKVEGNMTFHTALSTAFPQPAPGSAPSPGPMVVPAEKLRGMLGLSSVTMRQTGTPLAIVDSTLDK